MWILLYVVMTLINLVLIRAVTKEMMKESSIENEEMCYIVIGMVLSLIPFIDVIVGIFLFVVLLSVKELDYTNLLRRIMFIKEEK